MWLNFLGPFFFLWNPTVYSISTLSKKEAFWFSQVTSAPQSLPVTKALWFFEGRRNPQSCDFFTNRWMWKTKHEIKTLIMLPNKSWSLTLPVENQKVYKKQFCSKKKLLILTHEATSSTFFKKKKRRAAFWAVMRPRQSASSLSGLIPHPSPPWSNIKSLALGLYGQSIEL